MNTREMQIAENISKGKFLKLKDQIHKFAGMADALRTLIRNDITSIEITEHITLIHLKDGRKYKWNPEILDMAVWLLEKGTVEPDETAMVQRLVGEGNIALDIGANAGWYSILLANLVGENGEVHAFEPLDDANQALIENAELNGCTNLHVHPHAVSNKEGESELFVPSYHLNTLASLTPNPYVSESRLKCQLISLDRFVQDNSLSNVHFIKIDAEGHELAILQGAKQMICACHPILMLECLDQEAFEEIRQFLEPIGYSFYMAKQGVLVQKVILGQLGQESNIFCMRPEQAAPYLHEC